MSPTTIGKPPGDSPDPPDRGRIPLPGWLGRGLCWLGIHDHRVIDASFGFAPGETVERVECRRCGAITARRGQR
jgi:hypothetical protein